MSEILEFKKIIQNNKEQHKMRETKIEIDFLLSILEKVEMVEGLELQADDMAEKHAEKDILFNIIQTNMQKRIDYLLEALEDVSIQICLNRYDSGEKALSLIRKANQRDIRFREDLKKDIMS